MRKLIAFTGKTCSGKSSAAKYLAERHLFTRMSCIQPLRDLARSLWGDHRDADTVKFMCDVGARIRAIDPLLLLNPLRDAARLAEQYDAGIVVDDLRMKHEVPILQQLGFRIFRITCPDEVRRRRMYERDGYWPTDEALHAVTETDLDGYEFDEIDGSLPMEEFLHEVERRVLL